MHLFNDNSSPVQIHVMDILHALCKMFVVDVIVLLKEKKETVVMGERREIPP